KHAAKVRRCWRKLHIGVDADTGEIIAAELTSKDVDDGSQVGPLLEQIARPVASFTGDGAYDRDDVYREVCQRHPDAAVIVPPRSGAVPSATAETAPTKRDRHLQLIAERGRMGCQRASGYNWRALVEADIGRYKRVIDDALRSRTKGRQMTEVLIEDKASGTQLIQELIADGCHGVTRYQPECDKTMRLHAQTAMIENGFVHIPESVPWLAEYLHEMTVFPNGKHDDQVDSTAQFLDWFKKPFPGQGHYEWMRMQYERLQNPEKDRERHRVLLKGTPGMSVQTLSGQHLIAAWDGTLEHFADDAEAFIRNGRVKLGEWIENEPPEGEQIAEQNKPKVTYAPGSLEWEAQQEQERLARIAAEEEKEKRRLARVAAVLRKKL